MIMARRTLIAVVIGLGAGLISLDVGRSAAQASCSFLPPSVAMAAATSSKKESARESCWGAPTGTTISLPTGLTPVTSSFSPLINSARRLPRGGLPQIHLRQQSWSGSGITHTSDWNRQNVWNIHTSSGQTGEPGELQDRCRQRSHLHGNQLPHLSSGFQLNLSDHDA